MNVHFGLLILMVVVLSGCPDSKPVKPAEIDPNDTAITVDKVLAAKPVFPGFDPHPFNMTDTCFMRIVSNSLVWEKIWMVYYELPTNRWRTLTWTGSGLNNRIILDTVWTARPHIGYNHIPEDAPTFYAAMSKDSGKTWTSQPIYEGHVFCKRSGNNRGPEAKLLIPKHSADTLAKPDVAIIMQCRKGWGSYKPSAFGTWDFFCPVMRQF